MTTWHERVAAPTRLEATPGLVRYGGALLVVAAIWLISRLVGVGEFPVAWNIGLRAPIDEFQSWVIANRATHPIFTYGFTPFNNVTDQLLRNLETLLLALPWPVVILVVTLTAYWVHSKTMAAVAALGLVAVGVTGLWVDTQQTLALIAASVGVALIIGLPLGIWAARSPRFEALLRPVLDAMQTMPAFVYLIPVLLFFGVARVPSLVATVIYALPPVIRFTASGIRAVPVETVEAADIFGSSSRQKLVKVQLPLAMPSVLAGVNQTIMMALGMVVIAALIGAGGLGREVLVALQRLRIGQALEAGLAIVLLAVLLDRISGGIAAARRRRLERLRSGRSMLRYQRRTAILVWGSTALIVLVLFGIDARWLDLTTWPAAWQWSIQTPVDAAVRWLRDNLYQIGNLPIGTGPLSDFLTLYLLNPLRSLLQDAPWPVVVASAGVVGWLAAGRRLALFCAAALFFTGLLGLWDATLDTLSQVIAAVVTAVIVGLPLGVWSARSDKARTVMRPLLDLLQTIPVFVYLAPVIMLFHVGRVPGVIASVLYAAPPLIRLTDLGLRQVAPAALEAADAFGSTSWQRLIKVQIPLAMPSIMLGVNQTVMMVLAMVIIAGLVGGGALGFEAVTGLAKSELGRGVEAGLAIVILAIGLDRITQGWARSWTVPHQR